MKHFDADFFSVSSMLSVRRRRPMPFPPLSSISSLHVPLFLGALTLCACVVEAHQGPHEKMSMSQMRAKFQKLQQGNIADEDEHIREHLESIAKIPEEEMTVEQKQFHFFHLHDLNKDNKIDGIEILHAIIDNGAHDKSEWNEEEIKKMIDDVLAERDKNDDGFIDYLEFKTMVMKGSEERERDKAKANEV